MQWQNNLVQSSSSSIGSSSSGSSSSSNSGSSSSSNGVPPMANSFDSLVKKRGMKERFGIRREKRDGTLGAMAVVPPMHVLHTFADTRPDWIDYSALDAKVGFVMSCLGFVWQLLLCFLLCKQATWLEM